MVSTSSPPVRRIDYLLLLDTAPPDDASLLRLNSALLLSPFRHPHPRYYTALEQETIHASSLILPYTAIYCVYRGTGSQAFMLSVSASTN